MAVYGRVLYFYTVIYFRTLSGIERIVFHGNCSHFVAQPFSASLRKSSKMAVVSLFPWKVMHCKCSIDMLLGFYAEPTQIYRFLKERQTLKVAHGSCYILAVVHSESVWSFSSFCFLLSSSRCFFVEIYHTCLATQSLRGSKCPCGSAIVGHALSVIVTIPHSRYRKKMRVDDLLSHTREVKQDFVSEIKRYIISS